VGGVAPFNGIHDQDLSTAQRRGRRTKPLPSGGRRTVLMVMSRYFFAQGMRPFLAEAESPQAMAISGVHQGEANSNSRATRASWASAGVTTTSRTRLR
jgi:hypothetical protein